MVGADATDADGHEQFDLKQMLILNAPKTATEELKAFHTLEAEEELAKAFEATEEVHKCGTALLGRVSDRWDTHVAYEVVVADEHGCPIDLSHDACTVIASRRDVLARIIDGKRGLVELEMPRKAPHLKSGDKLAIAVPVSATELCTFDISIAL